MQVQIRRLELRDKPRWLELFHSYIDFYGHAVAPAVIDLTFQRLLTGEALVGLVAVDEHDRPVGLANLVFHPATWTATCHCYLEDLYVDPPSQGRGFGRLLIEATYAEADFRKASRVYWFTMADNARARALYDRMAKLSEFVQYRRDAAGAAIAQVD